MIKTISKSFVPVLKWGAVVVATATVVISIQANADGHSSGHDGSGHDSSGHSVENDTPVIRAEDLGIQPQTGSVSKPWSPAAGFADLIEDVSPAVVHVATSGYIRQRQFRGGNPNAAPRGLDDFFRGFPPSIQEQLRRQFGVRPDGPEDSEPEEELSDAEKQTRPLGIGSGFIISASGYVVTNHHVIDKADEIVVTLTDGTEYNAEITGSDPKTDLALLKLKEATDLPFLRWGDDDKSRVGDWVLAIGNPFGLGGSASTGIISARGRDIRSGPYDNFIQVDAAINRGNSGGPLFNMSGEVIGINSMIFSPGQGGGSVGIGFAIPATLAKNVITQLQSSGTVTRGWMGVSIGEVTDELAEAFQRNNEEGALVSDVISGSPAEKAGVLAGDIILSFNGKRIKEVRNLPIAVAQAEIGKTYEIEIWRKGKAKTLKITTERLPEPDAVAQSDAPSDETAEPEIDEALGAQLTALSSELRERYQLNENQQGVLVLSVERGSLAAKNGLQRGDVIAELNWKPVTKPEQVTDAMKAAVKAKKTVVPMLVERGGNPGFLPFNLK